MDNAKSDRPQPAFKSVFERLEKSITINKDLIEACEIKSSLLCGPVPSDIDEATKSDIKDSAPTIIDTLKDACMLIERNNSLLRQVLAELNNAI
jgi:hypothetical protein